MLNIENIRSITSHTTNANDTTTISVVYYDIVNNSVVSSYLVKGFESDILPLDITCATNCEDALIKVTKGFYSPRLTVTDWEQYRIGALYAYRFTFRDNTQYTNSTIVDTDLTLIRLTGDSISLTANKDAEGVFTITAEWSEYFTSAWDDFIYTVTFDNGVIVKLLGKIRSRPNDKARVHKPDWSFIVTETEIIAHNNNLTDTTPNWSQNQPYTSNFLVYESDAIAYTSDEPDFIIPKATPYKATFNVESNLYWIGGGNVSQEFIHD